MTKGPIVIIEDDPDDREIYADALKEIGIPNRVLFFDGGRQALDYLSTTEEQPFLFICRVVSIK